MVPGSFSRRTRVPLLLRLGNSFWELIKQLLSGGSPKYRQVATTWQKGGQFTTGNGLGQERIFFGTRIWGSHGSEGYLGKPHYNSFDQEPILRLVKGLPQGFSLQRHGVSKGLSLFCRLLYVFSPKFSPNLGG